MNKERLRPTLTAIFALGWLLIVFVAYLSTHKPFSPVELGGILQAVWRTLIALIIISTAGGLGLATPIRALELPPLTMAALSAALGLGLIGLATLLVGSLIGVNAFLWVLLLAAAFVLRKQMLSWWGSIGDTRRLWGQATHFSRILMLLVGVLLFCQYWVALAPPLQFDALTYHLAIPASFLQLGRITYLPGTIFWGMPQLTEMSYLLAMWPGGNEAATLLGWWIGALALAGLFGFAEANFSFDAGWVALAALLCGSALVTSLSSGYVEWETMLLGFSMLVCLTEWSLRRERLTLILAGLFAGLALGTKYTAGVAILGGITVILVFQKPCSAKRLLADLAWFGGAALLVSLPWWVRNFAATGNPFYPLLFPSGAMNATRLAQYQFKPVAQDWTRLALLPWLISILGIDGGMGYSASIGPLLLGLGLPALVLGWRAEDPKQRLIVRLGAGVLLTGLVVWAVASQFSGLLIQTRLYFAVFPAWALLCAAGYLAAARIPLPGGIRLKNIVGALVVLALGFNVFAMGMNFLGSGALPAALDAGARQGYLEHNLGAYQLAMEQINQLPAKASVLMLWETRGLECQPKCDNDEIIDRWSSDLATFHTPASIVRAWKDQGYTHVLFYRTGADFIRSHDARGPKPAAWDALYQTLASLRLVQTAGNAYELYALP